ncbi:MAG: CRISPR-associated endonuclease Cas1 [Saprospiraceae bacterium]
MQLVLDSKGLKLSKQEAVFLLESENGKRLISPAKLTSIAITANVWLSAAAVMLAINHDIPILFFNRIGKAQARLWSPYFASIATLRRQQIHFCDSTAATTWMIDLFGLKTNGQVSNLQYLKNHTTRLSTGLDTSIKQIRQQSRKFEDHREQLPEECRQNLMGIEGNLARLYWQSLGNALPRKYAFQKRTRRPAEDWFNATLNYLYGMLYSIIEGGLFAAGLDPHLGILHADEYKKPTLAFDLIEPFRPWIDRLLIEACWKDELKGTFFTKNQHGLFLNKEGKAFLIPLFNDYMRQTITYLDREATVKNHIYHMAGRLAHRIRTHEEG